MSVIHFYTMQCRSVRDNIHRMVQKPTSTPKRAGRPPSFDRDAVVSSATQAFWAKGYTDTTLGDLETATGVDRSTLYNSFDGKAGLYRSATTAYLDQAECLLFVSLHEGTAGIDDILMFLERLGSQFTAGTNPPGCLIVNDMADQTEGAATRRYLELLRDGLLAALARAESAGETSAGQVEARAHLLAAAVVGVNLVNRTTADTATTMSTLDGLRAEVESWRLPTVRTT
jgi:TetR/AcrR family transcriptional repressor of nem operon